MYRQLLPFTLWLILHSTCTSAPSQLRTLTCNIKEQHLHAAGCHLQFNDNVKFGTAFKHFVQFHDAVVVHSLTHDINLHQDFIAARFASSTFLQYFRGKLLPSLLTCATFHDRKLTPATRKREFINYNPVADHGLSTIATHRPSSDPTS